MAKRDIDYFETFSKMANCSVKAAKQLQDLILNFTDITAKADRIHDTEHESDELFHDMMIELNRAFITPIDREDIIEISNKIDSITDSIEDVSNLFDMLSVTEVRPGAPKLADIIVRCCEDLTIMVDEFRSFKHSKKLNDMCISVNKLEEEGDRLHRSIIKELYTSGIDTLVIVKWKEIYDTMEQVLDLCEDVADLLSGMAIKNS